MLASALVARSARGQDWTVDAGAPDEAASADDDRPVDDEAPADDSARTEGAIPDEIDAALDDDEGDSWDVSAFGTAREIKRVAGSAHRVDAEELERFEDDNIHNVLRRVPGVYVRGEDGYGLRPNIGLRGATARRSAKITLLEDGILFGPAPYSAPAAYYFPLTTRMNAIEVFKGPSALRHGPNTIGGAVNMVTRPIPWGHAFGADIALGTTAYGKGHAHYGFGDDHWGVLIEG
ncbi:MAG: TonB-dependent receptor plug domain-containing protein, partial [Polyangiaceae bacterium]